MRHLANFFITGFLMLIFQWIGWINIVQEIAPLKDPFLNQLIVAGIVGLIFTVGMWLVDLVFILFFIGTFGLGCFFLPVKYLLLGSIGFWAVTQILPGWIVISANWFQIFLMGILIAIIRVGSPSSPETSG